MVEKFGLNLSEMLNNLLKLTIMLKNHNNLLLATCNQTDVLQIYATDDRFKNLLSESQLEFYQVLILCFARLCFECT